MAKTPVTHKAVEAALQLKERVEKLVTGFEPLEQRLTAVEHRLDALEKSSKRTTPKKTTTARKTSAPKSSSAPPGSSTTPSSPSSPSSPSNPSSPSPPSSGSGPSTS